MATKTPVYGLNKPERTDPVSVDLLNENMDIIERELQNRATNTETPTGAVESVDLTSLTMHFDRSGGYVYPVTNLVDCAALSAAIDAGHDVCLILRHKGTDIRAMMTNRTNSGCSGTVDITDSAGDLVRGVFTLSVTHNYAQLTAEFNPDGSDTNKVTTELDFTNWSDGYFTEKFADGTARVHLVTRDDTGAITAIGGVSIVGVS